MKKVFITDLRYDYNGALSSDVMPLGIGYMKAFMIANLDDVQVDLFAYPTHLENFFGRGAARYSYDEQLYVESKIEYSFC